VRLDSRAGRALGLNATGIREAVANVAPAAFHDSILATIAAGRGHAGTPEYDMRHPL
jgi:hypothetical protein